MSLDDKTLKVCNCNRTMALDAKALAAALKLEQPIQIHTELCRKEVGSFQESLKDESCIVACTQEAPLFSELAREAGAATQLKFINIREHAGWSKEGAQATPKIAALLALAELPEPERRVLELRYGFDDEPHSLESIGAELGLSRERIRRLESEALAKLAVSLGDDGELALSA